MRNNSLTRRSSPGAKCTCWRTPSMAARCPHRVSLLPATGKQAWTTYVWDGKPGTPWSSM